MEELEKTARELILDIIEKTLKTLKDKGLLKKPSNLQMLCTSPEMTSLIKKLSSPKYDPCRPFRKGDIVTPKERNGRIPWGKDTKLIVVADETMAGVTVRDEESGEESFICALFLELVTPVQERVSFRVGDFPVDGEWSVWKNSFGKTEIISSYKIATHPNPKAAAEAERDRLNAEWRKEMEK